MAGNVIQVVMKPGEKPIELKKNLREPRRQMGRIESRIVQVVNPMQPTCCGNRNYGKMRAIIADQIREWRHTHPIPKVCPCCRKPVGSAYGWQVDHFRLPFRDLIRIWMKARDLEDEYTHSVIEWTPEMERDWAEFHKHMASLRYLCAECNRADGMKILRSFRDYDPRRQQERERVLKRLSEFDWSQFYRLEPLDPIPKVMGWV
jgi:hypothetical protein